MRDWIINKKEIATTPLRVDALSILEAGYDAIDTKTVIQEELKWDEATKTLCIQNENLCFPEYEHVYVVAIGKCAVEAAHAIEEIVGDDLTGGVVLDVHPGAFRKLKSLVGTHPLPTQENVDATKEIVSLLTEVGEKDLVIVVVSGGGSSLLCSPYEMSCATLSNITSSLMHAGATIQELNTVRKHLSKVQGGQLAKIIYPATVVGLLFSDVMGDDISMVASGAFSKDETTAEDASAILAKYEVLATCELPHCEVQETPKEDEYFRKVKTIVVVNNERALEAMKKKAEELGYRGVIVTRDLSGEARDVGLALSQETRGPHTAYIYGGETTVTVKGHGKGGRNQELALGALGSIQNNQVLISAASDGIDNSDRAGAIADSISKDAVHAMKLSITEYLEDNNSYEVWEKIGAHITTGITGSNVADLLLVLQK